MLAAKVITRLLRTLMASMCPSPAAMCRGVEATLSWTLAGQPACTRKRIASTCAGNLLLMTCNPCSA